MDDGEGRMRRAESREKLEKLEKLKKRFPKRGGTFYEGQRIQIGDSLFEVSKIIRDGLKLRLIKNSER